MDARVVSLATLGGLGAFAIWETMNASPIEVLDNAEERPEIVKESMTLSLGVILTLALGISLLYSGAWLAAIATAATGILLYTWYTSLLRRG